MLEFDKENMFRITERMYPRLYESFCILGMADCGNFLPGCPTYIIHNRYKDMLPEFETRLKAIDDKDLEQFMTGDPEANDPHQEMNDKYAAWDISTFFSDACENYVLGFKVDIIHILKQMTIGARNRDRDHLEMWGNKINHVEMSDEDKKVYYHLFNQLGALAVAVSLLRNN